MKSSGGIPLWRGAEVMLVSIVASAGVGLVLFAWYGAADQVETGQQIGWLSLSLGGAVVTAVGSTVWILSGRRIVAIRLREVTGLLATALNATAPVSRALSNTVQLVAIRDGQYAHRIDCQVIDGLRTEAVDVEPGVLPMCGWCGTSEPSDTEERHG